MKRVLFIKNTLVLTATALFLRFVGMIFKIWLSGRVGSEAIGLYQIIMSVYICAASFATSGLSTAVTRLVTDELAVSGGGVKKIVSGGVRLTIFAALICFLALFFGANLISGYIIGDMRAALPIKILSVSLFFIGICSCFRGYFIARRKALGSSVSQITEQLVRIALTAALVLSADEINVVSATVAIVIGDTAAEIVASLLLFIMYRLDVKGVSAVNSPTGEVKKLLNIAIPITSGRYLSTFLRTAESTAVPRLLALSGLSSAAAISSFGMIKGMALPLILFPSAVLSTVSLLLIPEISEAKAKNNRILLRSTVFTVLKGTTLISIIVGFVFLFCGKALGTMLYHEGEVGRYICLLAPLTPLMYIDSIADGMLKGLDKQTALFRYSVADSGIRLILIFFILKPFGIDGFIGIMYFSNILTAVLHFRMLIKTADIKINAFSFLILPIFIGFAVCYLMNLGISFLDLAPTLKIVLFCIFSCLCYTILLFAVGLVKKSDFTRL